MAATQQEEEAIEVEGDQILNSLVELQAEGPPLEQEEHQAAVEHLQAQKMKWVAASVIQALLMGTQTLVLPTADQGSKGKHSETLQEARTLEQPPVLVLALEEEEVGVASVTKT